MTPIQQAITGNETDTDAEELVGGLAEFYRAFNSRDFALMEVNWHQSDEIAMDNPLGGIARGWREIGPLYQKLFRSPMDVHVEFHDYTLHETTELAYAVGRERGTFLLDGLTVPVAIRTTRVFKKVGDRWRQVHHHGSIEDPELLKQYKYAASAGSNT